ncbi:MAG: ATP-dependent sacrificial sulfur transferase LarE [bacterium]|nr:ATP-dependent sacrificial sulfur transferase LarE [bacterium]
MSELEQKYEKLRSILAGMDGLIVGYSGGVDSTFLAKVATDVLGERALSAAAISESFSQHERGEARRFAEELGLNYVEVITDEMNNPEYLKNAPDRCYYCKQEMFVHLKKLSKETGIKTIAIGVIVDDLSDHRPGQKAAREDGVRMPLAEAELTKDDIRALSARLGVPTWDKPSFACLSSRFPYGEEITREKLAMVEQAEDVLRSNGFRQFRVRHHKDLARIEIPAEDMPRLLEVRDAVYDRLKEIGYAYISMDLKGYRSGSMNETLVQIEPSAALSVSTP